MAEFGSRARRSSDVDSRLHGARSSKVETSYFRFKCNLVSVGDYFLRSAITMIIIYNYIFYIQSPGNQAIIISRSKLVRMDQDYKNE